MKYRLKKIPCGHFAGCGLVVVAVKLEENNRKQKVRKDREKDRRRKNVRKERHPEERVEGSKEDRIEGRRTDGLKEGKKGKEGGREGGVHEV